MAHCFHQLYYHFVWSTAGRDPLISRSWRPKLLQLVRQEVANRGGKAIRQNAMPDHVHMLVRLPPTVLVSEFIGQLKGATSFRVNKEIAPEIKLQWQDGYGVMTLRKDDVAAVSRYIDRQEEHHKKGRLSDLLARLNVETDGWRSEPEAVSMIGEDA